MSRLETIFKTNKKVLVTFVTGCDPDYETSLEILKEISKKGSQIVEIGFYNAEAAADGPVISRACERASKAGGELYKVLELASDLRKSNSKVGIVLMGYISNIFQHGIEKFAEDSAKADVDAVLVVDLPEQAREEKLLREALNKKKISLIKLVAPNTPDELIKQTASIASGFIYSLNIKGISGTKKADKGDVEALYKKIKQNSKLPVCAGFGISTPEEAKQISETGVNGVVVGSKLISIIEENLGQKKQIIAQKVSDYVKQLSEQIS